MILDIDLRVKDLFVILKNGDTLDGMEGLSNSIEEGYVAIS